MPDARGEDYWDAFRDVLDIYLAESAQAEINFNDYRKTGSNGIEIRLGRDVGEYMQTGLPHDCPQDVMSELIDNDLIDKDFASAPPNYQAAAAEGPVPQYSASLQTSGTQPPPYVESSQAAGNGSNQRSARR